MSRREEESAAAGEIGNSAALSQVRHAQAGVQGGLQLAAVVRQAVRQLTASSIERGGV
jgi:hypothetical protein